MLFYSVVVCCLFAFFPQFIICGKNAYFVSLCFQNVMGLNIRGFIYLLILFHNTSRSLRRSVIFYNACTRYGRNL